MNVLDGMPTLSAGGHEAGTGRACVMEYVSLLAGERWSDNPKCTHPILADVARSVNDVLSDSNRHLLVPMIVRLFGTNAPVDTQFVDLAVSLRDTYGLTSTFTLSTLAYENPPKAVRFLSDLIDIYDRLSGRNTTHKLTDADMKVLVSVGGSN